MKCHHIVKCAVTVEERVRATRLMREGDPQSFALGALSLQGECAVSAQDERDAASAERLLLAWLGYQ